jgi:hypothetical protein
MSANLQWDDDAHSIILCTFEGEFDFETYGVLEGQLPMMVREAEHRVDVIGYLSVGASLPSLKGILPELRILTNVMPPNFGIFVGVGNGFLLTNPLSLWGASLLLRWYHAEFSRKVQVAGSIEAARQQIISERAV